MKTDENSILEAPSNASVLPPATGSSSLNVGGTERIISVIGGAALTVMGLRNLRTPRTGIPLTIIGSLLLSRGVSGFCPVNKLLKRDTANRKVPAMEVRGSFTINKPRNEVYDFWRNFENLPIFMKHLEEVKAIDATRSTWKFRIPGGIGTLTWEAEITEDQQNSYLSWNSLPGSTIDNAGEVRFNDAPGNKGTEIHATICYRAPAGALGGVVGKLFNPLVEQLVKEDLRRFKSYMETGEIPTTEGQPSGRTKDKDKAKASRKRSKEVEQTEGEVRTSVASTESQTNQQDYESTVLDRY